jgi:hypothetical protein
MIRGYFAEKTRFPGKKYIQNRNFLAECARWSAMPQVATLNQMAA